MRSNVTKTLVLNCPLSIAKQPMQQTERVYASISYHSCGAELLFQTLQVMLVNHAVQLNDAEGPRPLPYIFKVAPLPRAVQSLESHVYQVASNAKAALTEFCKCIEERIEAAKEEEKTAEPGAAADEDKPKEDDKEKEEAKQDN